MKFADNHPIYMQIVDLICDRILEGQCQPEERISSVREIAVAMEVNPNTAMRAYHYLQELGIIENQRGVGYFIASGAYDSVLRLKREEFVEQDLPVLFRSMELLGFSMKDIQRYYEQYRENHYNG